MNQETRTDRSPAESTHNRCGFEFVPPSPDHPCHGVVVNRAGEVRAQIHLVPSGTPSGRAEWTFREVRKAMSQTFPMIDDAAAAAIEELTRSNEKARQEFGGG